MYSLVFNNFIKQLGTVVFGKYYPNREGTHSICWGLFSVADRYRVDYGLSIYGR